MKSPYSDCSSCELRDQTLVFGETNTPENVENIDVLVLAESPSYDDQMKGRPLVGSGGSFFRKAFEDSGLNKNRYMISNVVLCANIQNLDGEISTINPSEEIVDRCKPNWTKMVELTNPKLILIMGDISSMAFGWEKSGITKRHGTIAAWNGKNVLTCFHPSYVLNNGGFASKQYEQFLNCFKYANEFLNGTQTVEENMTMTTTHTFNFPDWFISKDVNLIDIQNLREEHQLFFTFKNNQGKKLHHYQDNSPYYFYEGDKDFEDSPLIEKISNLKLVQGRPEQDQKIGRYESGLRTEDKMSVDYYYNRRARDVKECDVTLNIMHSDIEIYNNRNKNFSPASESACPINAISFKINSAKTNVWIVKLPQLDSNWDKVDFVALFPEFEVKFFDDEKALLIAYANLVASGDVDMVSGWNWKYYDIPTIMGRMIKNGINVGKLSPVGKAGFNKYTVSSNYIAGVIINDSLDLYKEFTYEVKNSYKLSAVAQAELGKDKVTVDGSLDIMYETDIVNFVKYSGTDTELLYELETKLGHIELKQELIKVTSSNWGSSSTTMGLVSPIVHSFLKDKGLTFRETSKIKTGEKIVGAFVFHPKPGLHSVLVDFDFASLYPNIARTYNIGPNTLVAKIDPEIALHYIYKPTEPAPTVVEVVLNPLYKNNTVKNVTYKNFEEWVDTKQYIVTVTGAIFKNHSEEISILYEIFSYLLDSRTKYKDLMKIAKGEGDNLMFKKYKNIQMAYKILANSIYGVLANENFFLFSSILASTITASGQEAIKHMCSCLSNYMELNKTDVNPYAARIEDTANLPYIAYGDTDSAFVQLGDWLVKRGVLTA